MSDSRITTVEEVREHMGSGADRWNFIVVTQATVFDAEGEEVNFGDGVSLQLEGFILHPRHLTHAAFEIEARSRDEIEYLIDLINGSQAALAQCQGEANTYAREAASTKFGRYAGVLSES